MKRLNDTTRSDKGAALIGVLFLVFLTTWGAAGIGRIMAEDSTMHRRVFARTSSNAIAQGALAQALGYLSENPEAFEDSTLPSKFQDGQMSGGSYRTSLTHLSTLPHYDPNSKKYRLRADAQYFDQSAWRRVYFYYPYKEAFEYGIFSDGDIKISGDTRKVAQGTHSNGDTIFKGSDQEKPIKGNMSAHGSVETNNKEPYEGESLSQTDEVDPPKVKLDAYYKTADTNGTVYGGKGNNQPVRLTNTSDTTNNELLIEEPTKESPTKVSQDSVDVIWIEGDVEIDKQPYINATVIATGNIIQKSNGTIDPPLPDNGEAPLALASRDGYIDFRGQSEIYGLVYTKASSDTPGNKKTPGDIFLHGGTDIRGSVVGHGTVDCQGTWALLNHDKPQPPLEDNYRMDIVAWE